jgi:serine/threonine protein kinase
VVAIKTGKKLQMTASTTELFLKEIETLKMAQHPNIVKLLDVFEDEVYFYIVMEYLDGGDMYEYLKERKFNISELRAKKLAYQITVAV